MTTKTTVVNGDASGLSNEEIAAADKFVAYMGGDIVSCGDDSFFMRPDVGGELRGDCVEYVALVSVEDLG